MSSARRKGYHSGSRCGAGRRGARSDPQHAIADGDAARPGIESAVDVEIAVSEIDRRSAAVGKALRDRDDRPCLECDLDPAANGKFLDRVVLLGGRGNSAGDGSGGSQERQAALVELSTPHPGGERAGVVTLFELLVVNNWSVPRSRFIAAEVTSIEAEIEGAPACARAVSCLDRGSSQRM